MECDRRVEEELRFASITSRGLSPNLDGLLASLAPGDYRTYVGKSSGHQSVDIPAELILKAAWFYECKHAVKKILKYLNEELRILPRGGDVSVRIRFGRCTNEEGCLSVENMIAEKLDATLTRNTEGKNSVTQAMNSMVVQLMAQGQTEEQALEAVYTMEEAEVSRATLRGGPGYFYIVELPGVPRGE